MHDRVEHVVDKDHRNDCAGCVVVPGLRIVGTSSSPASENDRHSYEGDEVLMTALEKLGQVGTGATCEQIPAGESEVDLILGFLAGDADGIQDFGEVVPSQESAKLALAVFSSLMTFDTRPFPDHCENVPTHAAIATRLRLPRVMSSSTHRRFEFSISQRTVVWISANSALTSALSRSPSA